MTDLKTIRDVADQECRCKAGIPYVPCRHQVAWDLLKIVDAQLGALLNLEWTNMVGLSVDHCPVCRAAPTSDAGRHYSHCYLDDALTLAGFPDQASRNAERNRRATARLEDAMAVVRLARMGDRTAQRLLEEKGVDWMEPPPVTIPQDEFPKVTLTNPLPGWLKDPRR